jgi:predicted protein tyrosine phosphatase
MILSSVPTMEDFIAVRSLREARQEWHAYAHVITIEDPAMDNGLRIAATENTRQTVFQFEDTDNPHSSRGPKVSDVQDMLLIGRNNVGRRMMLHCVEGKSRSAATALGIITDRMGPGSEDEAVQLLKRIRPMAVCNWLIVQQVDGLLRRGGALVAAWEREAARNDRVAGIMLLRELAAKQDGESKGNGLLRD